jgi:hypothetical protein
MVEVDFFSKYSSYHEEKEKGIPGFRMNKPIVTNGHIGKIGLELEIEGNKLPTDGHLEKIKAPKTNSQWFGVADGSLRGEAKEYIFSVPVLPEELSDMLNGLWGVFNELSSKINNSNRCSTHVHINMSGKTINQLTSIIVLWSIFEDYLIRWCGEERSSNHFCLGTKDTASVVSAWRKVLADGQFRFQDGIKYSALNVSTINSKGSFEFRCGAASNSPDIPEIWAKFLYTLTEYASTKYENPTTIAYALSERGGYEIFYDIVSKMEKGLSFADSVLKDTDRVTFDRACLESFRRVQVLVLGYPWDVWMEEIKKEYIPNPFEAQSPKKPSQLRVAPAPRLAAGLYEDMPNFDDGIEEIFVDDDEEEED